MSEVLRAKLCRSGERLRVSRTDASTHRKVKGGKSKRTIAGKLTLPTGVTKTQGCKGKVTIVLKKSGHSLLNKQVSLSKSCTFSQSVTASSKKQSFSFSAKFAGNTVLSAASTSRRFS